MSKVSRNVKSHLIFKIIAIIIFSIEGLTAPIIHNVSSNGDSVLLYSKFELTITLTASFSNPYNPNDLNLKVDFISPSGKIYTVNGFYYQDFIRTGPPETLAVNGSPHWKVRFTPNEIGNWTYTLSCTDVTGNTVTPQRNFLCLSSDRKGFIRIGNNKYLKFENGEKFFGIGLNLGWYEYPEKTFSYKQWLDSLEFNGANFIRVWMSENAFALEWKNTGLGNYSTRLDRAYQLDWLLDYAEQKNIFIQLCLVPHGQFSSLINPEWIDNPYNSANGGPCAKPWEFFTNSTARDLFKRKLRYIIARWGYSPNLLAWEFFNEVDHTDSFDVYRTSVTNWHLEMAQFIKSNDPTKRLVTTSYANEFLDSNIWSSPLFDFTQIHHYNTTTDMQSAQVDLTALYLSDFGKPVSIGEYDFLELGPWAVTNDPKGINFHNSLWTSVMSGAFSTALTWSWENYIDPKNLFHHFKPVAEFGKDVKFLEQNFVPVRPLTFAATKTDFQIAPAYPRWGKGPINNFSITSDGNINPTAINLSKFLYGNVYNTEHRNPPTFSVTYSQPGEFKVIIGNAVGTSPRIQIWLNGAQKFEQIVNVNATYSISVPAGSHQIFVDNQGVDWMRIAEYVFTNFVGGIRSYALKGNTEIIGWIQNRNYNWRHLRDLPTPPAIISNGQIKIPNLINRGFYKIEWWDCSKGMIFKSDTVSSMNDTLTINVPPIFWDYAFKAKYLGPTSIASDKDGIYGFELFQNFPNPFNPETKIRYSVIGSQHISLKIYDVLGREIVTLVDEVKEAGVHTSAFSILNYPLPSGIYIYQLKAGGFTATKKLMLMK
ncbi:MAG: DUF5060 domain-containing protein [Bacteroidetes bacterium]|nr:DUF5060 domain-containing protein [Bacteroidota bacterium]